MNPDIPSIEQLKAALCTLSYAQTVHLAKLSGVPFTTIWNVRKGSTENPGIETVRKFAPHIESAGCWTHAANSAATTQPV